MLKGWRGRDVVIDRQVTFRKTSDIYPSVKQGFLYFREVCCAVYVHDETGLTRYVNSYQRHFINAVVDGCVLGRLNFGSAKCTVLRNVVLETSKLQYTQFSSVNESQHWQEKVYTVAMKDSAKRRDARNSEYGMCGSALLLPSGTGCSEL